MKKQFVNAIWLSLIVWLGASSAFAQIGGMGSIQGIVTDASSSVIANATVVATNVGTGTQTTRTTTSAGFYVVAPLPPGTYTVTVTANCNVQGAGTCWASYNPAFTGSARINGAWETATYWGRWRALRLLLT